MKLVSEEVSTSRSTMTVVHCKEGAPWPIFDLLKFWSYDVKNDRDPIFIVVPHNALMGVGTIGRDNAVLLTRELGGVVRRDESIDLLLFHLHVFLLLLNCHNESSIGC